MIILQTQQKAISRFNQQNKPLPNINTSNQIIMKKLFYLMLVVLNITACSKQEEDTQPVNQYGQITMVQTASKSSTTNYTHFRVFTFDPGDEISVAYGDGTIEKVTAIDNYAGLGYFDLEHSYPDNANYTVMIQGEIQSLYCNFLCPLIELDISGCPALEILYCENNQLTSLDVSKNTKLYFLSCSHNLFTAEEMDKIYRDLPVVENGTLWCDPLGNPSIAEQKGWYVHSYK